MYFPVRDQIYNPIKAICNLCMRVLMHFAEIRNDTAGYQTKHHFLIKAGNNRRKTPESDGFLAYRRLISSHTAIVSFNTIALTCNEYANCFGAKPVSTNAGQATWNTIGFDWNETANVKKSELVVFNSISGYHDTNAIYPDETVYEISKPAGT